MMYGRSAGKNDRRGAKSLKYTATTTTRQALTGGYTGWAKK